MWNDRKSILLSKLCVWLFAACVAAVAVGAPWGVKWFVALSQAQLTGREGYFLSTIYCAVPLAAAVLAFLYQLLGRIQKGEIFVRENVRLLRAISWCCFGAALVCLASALYYLPYLLLAALAAFMALIVRVVKNVFEQAILLKDEIDYTI